MLFQIGIDACAKRIFTQVRFKHPQHRRRFAVRDTVKQLLNLRRGFRGLMNGTRISQRVGVESLASSADVVEIEIPFRPERLNRFARHPCREAFVEPDIVPPFHGDEIAEPLVRHFVRNYASDVFLEIDRSLLFVNQQDYFPESDATRVLHRARGEIG